MEKPLCAHVREINQIKYSVSGHCFLPAIILCVCPAGSAGRGQRDVSTWEDRWRVCVCAQWKDDAYNEP